MSDYEVTDSVAVIRVDDGKANVVGHDFIDHMEASLDRAEQEASAVILIGREGMFSAGFDLKEIQKGADAAAKLVDRGARMLLRLFTHPQPVIAAASGHAIAAGAFVLLAADTRFAASGDFKFGLNETAIGMSLPVFGIQLASARLAQQHLTQAVTQATIYEVDDARSVGFVDQIVDAGQLHDQALAEAKRLGEFDASAYKANKLAWRQPYIDTITASLS